MNYDPELAVLLSQPWSNDACRGYDKWEPAPLNRWDTRPRYLPYHFTGGHDPPLEASAFVGLAACQGPDTCIEILERRRMFYEQSANCSPKEELVA